MNSYVVCMSDFKGSISDPKGLGKLIIKANSKNDAIIKFIDQIRFKKESWMSFKIEVEELGVVE